MWWFEIGLMVIIGACWVFLVIAGRRLALARERLTYKERANQALHSETQRLANKIEHLADDLEWLWDEFPCLPWTDLPWAKDEYKRRRALRVSLFVRERRARRNLARGMAQASFEAQQRENMIGLQTSMAWGLQGLSSAAAASAFFPPGVWLSERIGFSFPSEIQLSEEATKALLSSGKNG